jgi:hypothetical protein
LDSYHSGQLGCFIVDNDIADGDPCFIDYVWRDANGTYLGGMQRIVNPQVSGWRSYSVSAPSGATQVMWQVCRESESDPYICSPFRIDPK